MAGESTCGVVSEAEAVLAGAGAGAPSGSTTAAMTAAGSDLTVGHTPLSGEGFNHQTATETKRTVDMSTTMLRVQYFIYLRFRLGEL